MKNTLLARLGFIPLRAPLALMKTSFVLQLADPRLMLALLALFAGAPPAAAQHFIFHSSLAVGNTPTAVVAADLSGDGRPELICANYFGNSLTVLTRGPNGLFTNWATVFVEGNPFSLVAADVNGDGELDVVTANDSANTLTVLTNSGNGTLLFATNVFPGTRPLSVKVADVNGDARLDLISANHGDSNLTVLTNDSQGGFSHSVTLAGAGPLVAADINGDGALDLIAAKPGYVYLTVLTNNGSGTFTESVELVVPSPLGYLAAADLNGDGKPDLITANDPGTTIGAGLTILTNRGNGTFRFAPAPAGEWSPASFAVADINEDSRPDLIGVNQLGLNVLTNIGNGTFSLSAVVSVANRPISVIAANVVGDARPDLIFVNDRANSLTILRSVPPSPATTPHTYDFSIGASLAPGLQGPRGVAVDRGGNLYVTDTGNNRVVKFSSRGQFLAAWGRAGSAAGEFSGPFGITIDSKTNVFVADPGNGRIQKFNRNGAYLTQWAASNPSAVTIDLNDRVYVSSSGVRKFTSDGTLLQTLPIDTTPYPVSVDAYSSAGLAVSRNGDIYLAFSFYDRMPFGGSVSGAGIERLTGNGSYINVWGGFGNLAPDGLALDGAGHVYAADRLNKQIKKFNWDGTPLTQWEIPGGRADPVSDLRGVAVDSSGSSVYVADSGNNRILVFARRPTLSMRGAGANGTVLSWSAAALGFTLQSTPSLIPPVTWQDVTNPPTVLGGQFTVTNSISSDAEFFRLKKP